MKKSLIIILILASLLVVSCKPEEPVIPSNYSSEYPVILLHGWMGRAVDFNSYADRLQEEGIAEKKSVIDSKSNASVCPDKWPVPVSVRAEYYSDANKDKGIEAYAVELHHAVDLVINCTNAEQVIIVGHSMGGLVARKYMVDYGDEKVHKLITLATPHHGFNNFTDAELLMKVLDIFTGRGEVEVKQMRPNSDFLNKLNLADKDFRDKIVSIGTFTIGNGTSKIFDLSFLSDSDVVVKLDSTRLEGAEYYQITGCSHTPITDLRIGKNRGSINDANKCSQAYDIVKKEVMD